MNAYLVSKNDVFVYVLGPINEVFRRDTIYMLSLKYVFVHVLGPMRFPVGIQYICFRRSKFSGELLLVWMGLLK